MKKKIAIIGAGFSGLSAAAFLAHQGMEVDVFEKNDTPGGRARPLQAGGFSFNMGPASYYLPDVFENFFEQFGKKPSDYYELRKIDPSVRIFNKNKEYVDIPADLKQLAGLFESVEKGSGDQLQRFLEDARKKYELGMKKLAYKPSLSIWEFVEPWLFRGLIRMDFIRSVSQTLRDFFHDPRLIRMLEFPVIFLGAKPSEMPAIYTFVNYADLALGSWYPVGGMHAVAEALFHLATAEGARFHFNSPVTHIVTGENKATGLKVKDEYVEADMILSTADYHFTETVLLDPDKRSYRPSYWEKKIMAPSALLFYVGLNRRIEGLLHHNLFFDEDFTLHAEEIYDRPQWPASPVMHVACSSKTDPDTAPPGHENLVVLIPVAPGLTQNPARMESYFELFLKRFENLTGEYIRNNIVYLKSYGPDDFTADYHSFKGTAFGMANTLFQTAVFKPSLKSKKVKNLFYAGQLTVPGPGVPTCIISGQVAATEILKRI